MWTARAFLLLLLSVNVHGSSVPTCSKEVTGTIEKVIRDLYDARCLEKFQSVHIHRALRSDELDHFQSMSEENDVDGAFSNNFDDRDREESSNESQGDFKHKGDKSDTSESFPEDEMNVETEQNPGDFNHKGDKSHTSESFPEDEMSVETEQNPGDFNHKGDKSHTSESFPEDEMNVESEQNPGDFNHKGDKSHTSESFPEDEMSVESEQDPGDFNHKGDESDTSESFPEDKMNDQPGQPFDGFNQQEDETSSSKSFPEDEMNDQPGQPFYGNFNHKGSALESFETEKSADRALSADAFPQRDDFANNRGMNPHKFDASFQNSNTEEHVSHYSPLAGDEKSESAKKYNQHHGLETSKIAMPTIEEICNECNPIVHRLGHISACHEEALSPSELAYLKSVRALAATCGPAKKTEKSAKKAQVLSKLAVYKKEHSSASSIQTSISWTLTILFLSLSIFV